MLDIAETILQSALQREESRGAHQRTDFTIATTRGSLTTRWPTAWRTVPSGLSGCQ